MQLRDLIKDKHEEAESHRFARYLFSGDISVKAYADYLNNQYYVYSVIENRARDLGLMDGIETICRSGAIKADLEELRVMSSDLSEFSQKKYGSVIAYEKYVRDLPKDNVMAHIYVRHFGDMYGGAMIKTKVPGNGSMYVFENKQDLIKEVRSRLSVDMAKEANIVFDFAVMLFEELAFEHNIQ